MIVDPDTTTVVSIADVSAREDSMVDFTVTRSREVDFSVSYRTVPVRGGATAGDDYTAQARRKTVEIDQTSTTISVDTLPDELDEPDEKFTVELQIGG